MNGCVVCHHAIPRECLAKVSYTKDGPETSHKKNVLDWYRGRDHKHMIRRRKETSQHFTLLIGCGKPFAQKRQSITVPPPETPRDRKWRQMKEDADVGIPCWFCGKKILLGTIFCQRAARQKRLSEQQEVKAQEGVQAGSVIASINCRLRGFKHGIATPEQIACGRAKEHFRRGVRRGTKEGNTGWRHKYISILDRWEQDAEYRASVKSRTCYKGRRENMVRFDPQPRQEA